MKKKTCLKLLYAAFLAACVTGLGVIAANIYVKAMTKHFILSEADLSDLEGVDCVLVLGCGVRKAGRPSDMLSDRIAVGVRAYKTGVSERILMTGDHGRTDYDEVNAMKAAAVESGIEPDNIFCDHAGFSTYESMYRAADIFGAEKIVIVTQGYHLYRAIYDAQKMGITAYGVPADERHYIAQWKRDIRELLARAKDVIWCFVRPEPTYRGEKIPLTGPGSLTDG